MVRTLVLGVLGGLFFLPAVGLSDSEAGISGLVDSARSVVLALALAVVAYVVGTAVTRRLVDADDKPATVILVANFLIGCAALGAVLLSAGLLGLFDSLSVRLIVIGLLVLVWNRRTLTRSLAVAKAAIGEMRRIFTYPGGWVGGVILVGFLALFLVVALGPSIGWDEAMYHLDLPEEFLTEGRIYLPDDNLHTAYVASPQMMNAVLLASSSATGPAVFHWVSAFLVFPMLAIGGHLLLDRRAGVFAAIAGLSVPAFLRLGSQAMVDVALILAVLALVLWAWQINRGRPSNQLLVLVLLAVSAFLIKYQAIPYIAGTLLVAFLFQREALKGVKPTDWARTLAVSGIGLLPFLFKNWYLIGAPLYPFFSEYRYPDWISGGRSGDVVDSLSGPYGVLASGRDAFTPWAWLLSPRSLSVEDASGWTRFPFVFLLSPIALGKVKLRDVAWLLIPAVFGVAAIIAVSPKTNTRYLLPALALVAIVMGAAITVIVDIFSESRRRLVSGMLAFLLIAPTLQLLRYDIIPSSRVESALGIVSQQEWATQQAIRGRASHTKLMWLNETLASMLSTDERALLLLDARGYFFDVPVIQDNLDSNWPMLQELLSGECPMKPPFSHVVWNLDVESYLSSWGVPAELLGRTEFLEFADRCLSLTRTVPGFEIYEIAEGSGIG